MRTFLSIHFWVRLILLPLALMMTDTALAVSFTPMLSSSEVNEMLSKQSMNDLLVSSCVSNYCVYLPLVIEQVPEIWPAEFLYPPRWPHSLGQSLNISYRWVDELTNPNHTWRYAFQYGIDDWNGVPSNINFYLDNDSSNTIDMIYDSLEAAGYTDIGAAIVNGITTTIYVHAYGNLYWDIHDGYTNNQRRAVAEHEIGHMLSIFHIPRSYNVYTLMVDRSYPHELEQIYTPQHDDINLLNRAYP